MLEFTQFSLFISDKNIRSFNVKCSPHKYSILDWMMNIYRTSEKIEHLISEIESFKENSSERRNLGKNDISFDVQGEITLVHFTADDSEPVELLTDSVIEFFNKYLNWVKIYEEGRIPGVIPTNMLNNWKDKDVRDL